MKYYLVTAEFLIGEFGQYFYHTFKVRTGSVEKRIDHYFTHYYEDKRLCEKEGDNRYLYHAGQVMVKVQGWQEITKEEYEVLNKFNI
jgi:hypothetical protein